MDKKSLTQIQNSLKRSFATELSDTNRKVDTVAGKVDDLSGKVDKMYIHFIEGDEDLGIVPLVARIRVLETESAGLRSAEVTDKVRQMYVSYQDMLGARKFTGWIYAFITAIIATASAIVGLVAGVTS